MSRRKTLTEECWVTGSTINLHRHHIFYGSNRKMSEKYGMCVMLRADWHNMSNYGVHFNKSLNDELKEWGQRKFIEMYPDLDFLKIFGRNFI